MAGNEVTVEYHLLPQHNPDDHNEIRRYRCSECDDDIFNLNVHAQFSHDTLLFNVHTDKEVEVVVVHDPPFHPCGIMGCILAPHEEGLHSWQSRALETPDFT